MTPSPPGDRPPDDNDDDTPRPPPWRDVRVLRWAFQALVAAATVALVAWMVGNVRTNSDRQGIPTGYGYLDQPAQLSIPGNGLRATQPVRDAIWQGTLNTVRVAVAGVVLATLLGLLVGIGRLSGNWLVRTAARAYVEVVRNVPLLAVVVFTYLAFVLAALPKVDDAATPLGIMVLSNRGAVLPWYTGSAWALVPVAAAAAAVAFLTGRVTRAAAERRHRAATPWWPAAAAVAALLAGLAVAGIRPTLPDRDGRVITGGISLTPEYFALLVALVAYTASHIAEIVRGSIQAVPRGQDEAARALALGAAHRLWYVVLPQAMRIAVPPMGNQALNLLKNSSLGFAISYFELTKVTSVSIGNAKPAVPSFLLLMGIYLVLCLALSGVVNLLNHRLALVER